MFRKMLALVLLASGAVGAAIGIGGFLGILPAGVVVVAASATTAVVAAADKIPQLTMGLAPQWAGVAVIGLGVTVAARLIYYFLPASR